MFTGFLALGTWQVERRAWKLDLIARVDARVHAAPVPAPAAAQWSQLNRADDEYRRVQVTGTLLNDKETLVQAVTELGAGFWVLTPLRQADGTTVMINRGFVAPEVRAPGARGEAAPAGPVTVTGLLRLSEPGGGFLRKNAPAEERWYSRDVQAMATVRGVGPVAPFFIDAQSDPGRAAPAGTQTWPAPGLTVITFANSHLVYAITWYALALMVAGAAWYAWREGRHTRTSRIGDNGV
nr:SURF1 family protein [Variovorax ginsengisoli]